LDSRRGASSTVQRKKSLLPELLDRNRAGGIIDRRFGEDNPNLTPEEKALERFTRERQRKGARASAFNLEDDDQADLDGGLTHYGQSLGDGEAGPAPLSRAWTARGENDDEAAHEVRSSSELCC
jgi:nucleolar protein 14